MTTPEPRPSRGRTADARRPCPNGSPTEPAHEWSAYDNRYALCGISKCGCTQEYHSCGFMSDAR